MDISAISGAIHLFYMKNGMKTFLYFPFLNSRSKADKTSINQIKINFISMNV